MCSLWIQVQIPYILSALSSCCEPILSEYLQSKNLSIWILMISVLTMLYYKKLLWRRLEATVMHIFRHKYFKSKWKSQAFRKATLIGSFQGYMTFPSFIFYDVYSSSPLFHPIEPTYRDNQGSSLLSPWII